MHGVNGLVVPAAGFSVRWTPNPLTRRPAPPWPGRASRGRRAGRRRPSSRWGRRCRAPQRSGAPVLPDRPAGASSRRADRPATESGSPFSSTSSRSGATPLAASTARPMPRGQHQVGRRAAGWRSAAARAAARRTSTSQAHTPASTTRRARPQVAVDEELAGAEPPEVVHGDDDPGPGRAGRRQQPGAERLQGVHVHDVGSKRSTWARKCSVTAGFVQLRSSAQPIHGEDTTQRTAMPVSSVSAHDSSGGRSPIQPA